MGCPLGDPSGGAGSAPGLQRCWCSGAGGCGCGCGLPTPKPCPHGPPTGCPAVPAPPPNACTSSHGLWLPSSLFPPALRCPTSSTRSFSHLHSHPHILLKPTFIDTHPDTHSYSYTQTQLLNNYTHLHTLQHRHQQHTRRHMHSQSYTDGWRGDLWQNHPGHSCDCPVPV